MVINQCGAGKDVDKLSLSARRPASEQNMAQVAPRRLAAPAVAGVANFEYYPSANFSAFVEVGHPRSGRSASAISIIRPLAFT